MRISYREGDWFAVPLRGGGWATGVVARKARSAVLLGYFFGPPRSAPPGIQEVADLCAQDAILVERFGDLGIIDGSWPLIGSSPTWDRAQWPMPMFCRREPLSGRAFLVEYPDANPNGIPRETPVDHSECDHLPRDGMSGFGSVERELTRRLKADTA